MKIIEANVKYPAGKIFDGRWGRRQNIVLESVVNGDEIKIWFGEGDRRYVDLKRGERVQLLKEKDKYTIVTNDEDEETPPMPPTTQANPSSIVRAEPAEIQPTQKTRKNGKQSRLTDEERKRIYGELMLRADIIQTCHLEIHKRFATERGELIITEETLQKYAVTLYIGIQNMIGG